MCLAFESAADWAWPSLDEFCGLPHDCKLATYASLLEENARLQDALAVVSSSPKQVERQETETEQLKEQVEALRAAVAELRAASEAQAKEMATLTTSYRTVDDWLVNLEGELDEHGEQLATLETAMDDCREGLEQLEDDLAELQPQSPARS